MIRKIAGFIRKGCFRMLLGLEEHAVGILVTIAFHLLVIAVALILKINAYTQREPYIMVDLPQIDADLRETPEEPQEEENAQTFVQKMQQEYNIRNIPVNIAENRAVENIDKMVRDIKTEMNIIDAPFPSDQPEERTAQEEKMREEEARIYNEKYPENEMGERTVYRGLTTVSYELSGRRHLWMPVPAYKCKGQGKIVVDIVVNPKGYVLSAAINRTSSDSQDPCLTDAAKRDAERSRFNSAPDAPPKQTGSITYIFVAQ